MLTGPCFSIALSKDLTRFSASPTEGRVTSLPAGWMLFACISDNNSSITIQYSRALNDIETIKQIKKDQSKLQQFELEESQLITDLTAEIIALYTLIEEYNNILDVTLNQIMIAQQQQKAEEALYKQGRTNIDMVIQSQDNVLNTKLNYANLSAAYQKYVVTYQSLTDELIDVYGVQL